MVKVTLILCTCKRPEMIERLLKSIEGLPVKPDQIIVVDASDDSRTSEMSASFPDLHIEYYHGSKGLTQQRNIGLTKATGEVIGFFDDDIVPDPDFFEELKTIFSDSTIYGVVPYIYENNEKSLSGFGGICLRITSGLWGRKYIAKSLGKGSMPDEEFHGLIGNITANGCSFYRREVYEKFHFADWMEGYCYGEDIDFGLRVSQKYNIVGSGDTRLHHWHNGTGKGNPFVFSSMSVYNFVRIAGMSGQGFVIMRKTDIMLRRLGWVLFTFLICLMKFQLKYGFMSLAGGLYGAARSFPWLFIKQV